MKPRKKKYTKAEARSLRAYLKRCMTAQIDKTPWSKWTAKQIRQYSAWNTHVKYLEHSYGVK